VTRFSAIFIAGSAACAATTAGIYTISRFEEKSRLWSLYFVSFAAGVLIGVSFLHLIPKALSMHHTPGRYFLTGFIILYVMEQLTGDDEKNSSAGEDPAIGLLAVIGMGFHSLVDGAIYAITFSIDMITGVLSSIGMVLHEFPEGVIMFALLKKGGYTRRKSFLYAFLATGLTTPAGAVVSFPLFSHLTSAVLGRLLAVSAGFLIYLGAVHLLPMILKKLTPGIFITFFSGVLLALVIRLFKHA